jgi:hypothetical protein
MPSTAWSEITRGFVIYFPKKATSAFHLTSTLTAKFHGDILGAFKPAKASKSSAPGASSSTESWVGVGDDDSNFDSASILTPSRSSTTNEHLAYRSAAPVLQKIPDVSVLDRPESLCARAPYHIIVRAGERQVSVEASHQPSLEILSKYLKKWTKTNAQFSTKPPMAEVELRGSAFGLSTMWDRLDIAPQHQDQWTKLNPMLILCFLESVLGYRVIFQDVGYWHFRRDVDFK